MKQSFTKNQYEIQTDLFFLSTKYKKCFHFSPLLGEKTKIMWDDNINKIKSSEIFLFSPFLV